MSDYTEDWHGQEAREEAESRTGGEAMSTADDAWQEWRNRNVTPPDEPSRIDLCDAYLAGWQAGHEAAVAHEVFMADRAAGVGIDKQDACLSDGELASNSPTKDGTDDE